MHTPGPWIIVEEKAGKSEPRDKGGYRIDSKEIEQIAFVWNATCRYVTDQQFGSERGLADARLIAAAPDLLDAEGHGQPWHPWFAWRPVRLEQGGLAWLRQTWRRRYLPPAWFVPPAPATGWFEYSDARRGSWEMKT